MNKIPKCKRVLVALAMAVVTGLIVAVFIYLRIEPSPQAIAQELQKQAQAEASAVIREIRYIKDPRLVPPVCFAYYYSNLSNGGPTLATVPCGSIPTQLLTTVNLLSR